jgi:4'-phosphopantetheinyl transferase EntD
MMDLVELFGPGVAVATADPRLPSAPLYPEEAAYVAHAVEKRRLEFAAGRSCARAAMEKLGVAKQPVPAGADRAPIWPDGVVGSISHCDGLCAAVVARAGEGFVSLGLDLEPAVPLEDELIDTVCGDDELRWLSSQPGRERGLLAKAIFCAKEAFYKAQYPLSLELIDFHAISVALEIDDNSFLARFHAGAWPFQAGQEFRGRLAMPSSFIAAGMVLKEATAHPVRRMLSA